MRRITAVTDADTASRSRTLSFVEICDARDAERIECPTCQSARHVSDNDGRTMITLGFCCEKCGEQFDAGDLMLTDEARS